MSTNPAPQRAVELDHLVIRGAAEHNLRGIDLSIPKKKLVVFTGVSGSGKSSLAFDTLYAEGQRRYVESLSAYARQFLGQMEKPHYDSIRGLSPTIAIEQKAASKNPRSTVGTITEIYDYLRVLYARVGIQHCPKCDRTVESMSAQQIVERLLALPERTKYLLLAPVVEHRKGEFRELLDEIRRDGFTRIRLNGEVVSLDDELSFDKKFKYTIEVVVDRLISKPGTEARVTDSVETALKRGEGKVIISLVESGEDRLYSEANYCSYCDMGFPELTPQSFSFNSPLGMCKACNGLGTALEIEAARVIPDDSLAISEGAIKPWKSMGAHPSIRWMHKVLKGAAKVRGFDVDAPWSTLGAEDQDFVLHGGGEEKFKVYYRRGGRTSSLKSEWEGVIPRMMRRWRESESDSRMRYASYFTNAKCGSCHGHRLRPSSASVRLGPHGIIEVNSLTIGESHAFFRDLDLSGNRELIASELLKEIVGRLRFLCDVGLSYLTLNRSGPTLSGGESQRIRLASQIGSELCGVIYILDEPSIGLHARDNRRLINTLEHLRDLGNSVIVVEHDAEMMESSDWLVDFGPGAGRMGGMVVVHGPPEVVKAAPESLTGGYLSGRLSIEGPETRRRVNKEKLRTQGAEATTLRGVDVEIPVVVFTCVTGVSGAGKSSLVNGILYPAAARALNGANSNPGKHKKLSGLEHFDKCINIDQSPIGRTPRSNPATYTKLWDDIRRIYANTREAKAYGFKPGRFSFNVKGGRCETCQGAGVQKVEMHFLADVYVQCESCAGQRFNEATLRVKYREKTISDLLNTSINEAAEIFQHHKKVGRTLRTMQDVGLGYLHLGQASTTLSGGEAQRIKLSRELAKRATGRTLYILDEPSTGLHFEDVRKLLDVVQRLVEAGNTVVMIEHNLDIIKTADWVIDLGPEGGSGGGLVIAAGSPEEVAKVEGSYTGQYLADLL